MVGAGDRIRTGDVQLGKSLAAASRMSLAILFTALPPAVTTPVPLVSRWSTDVLSEKVSESSDSFPVSCRRADSRETPQWTTRSRRTSSCSTAIRNASPRRLTFVGLEELGSSLSRLDHIYREFSSRLAILPSGENAFLYLGLMGAPGTIAADSNFAPRVIGEFLAACHGRELDRALDIFGRRRGYRDLFREGLSRGLPMFVPYTKAAMELLGLRVGRPRPPQESPHAGDIGPLRDALRREFGLAVAIA